MSFMAQDLLDPLDFDGSSAVSISSGEDNLHLPGKENALSSAPEASLLGTALVTVSAVDEADGGVLGAPLGPPLSPELLDGDAKSAGVAQLMERSFCKKCFKRVLLGKLLLPIALRS